LMVLQFLHILGSFDGSLLTSWGFFFGLYFGMLWGILGS
jgi:hypothetical protein